MKISRLLVFFLISIPFILFNAQSINGQILEIDEKYLNNIEISIFNKARAYKGNIDKKGKYYFDKVNTGKYNINIVLNKKIIYTDFIVIDGSDKVHDINLKERINNIDEIIINNNNSVIQKKLEKLIFNVSESMYANGFDASEVLSKVPMVKVNEQGISIINRGKILLLIDNKRTFIEGVDLINYLKNIPSNTISKIEVITNPSSNYDAEGSVGVINIITKKDLNNLLSLGISSSYTKRKGENYINALNISYNKKSLNITSRFNYSDQRNINKSYSKILKSNTLFNESDIEKYVNNRGNSFFTSINYGINENFDFGVNFDIRKIELENQNKNLLSKNTNAIIYNSKRTSNKTINAFTSYKLDSLGKKIEISGTYFYNKNDIEQRNNILLNNNNDFKYNIISTQADVILPFKNTLEILTGAKTTFVNNEQTYFFNQDYIDSNFKEKIYAAYFSFSHKLFEKMHAKGGLRYENYSNEINNIITNKISKNTTNSLFPSAYIDYDINKDNKISLSYSRRISRPNFRYLDPFRVYYSNEYYETGNPDLSAFYTNNIELNYSYKKFNILLYRTENKNMFSKITRIEGGYQVDFYENFFNLKTSGMNIRYSFNKIKNVESNIMTNISYSDVKMLNDSFIPRKGIVFYYYIDNNIFLNKEKTLFFNLSYLHSLPTNSVNSYIGNVANLSGGIKLFLLKKQMQLNLSFNDLFKQQRDKGKYYYNGYDNTISDYLDVQSITFGFTYRIGKAKTKNNKTIIYERNRTD